MSIVRNRSTVLMERFPGREDLGKDGLFQTFFCPLGYDKTDVLECLEEIEIAFGIPSGILRPDDELVTLNERVLARNPLEWFWWVGENEFGADGLYEELNNRLAKYGTQGKWQSVKTLADLMAAWCGKSPGE